MNWEQALELLLANIIVGDDLDPNPNHQYKIVIQIPPYECQRYDYNGAIGFKIQVGADDYIDVPLNMLQTIHNASLDNGGVYNGLIFNNLFPIQRSNKPCHVHVVGKLFECAGIAIQVNNQNYSLI